MQQNTPASATLPPAPITAITRSMTTLFSTQCGSCILPMVESPYSSTFQTSLLSSSHSRSTILNPVVQIQLSKSGSPSPSPSRQVQKPLFFLLLSSDFFSLFPDITAHSPDCSVGFQGFRQPWLHFLYPPWYFPNCCTFTFSIFPN